MGEDRDGGKSLENCKLNLRFDLCRCFFKSRQFGAFLFHQCGGALLAKSLDNRPFQSGNVAFGFRQFLFHTGAFSIRIHHPGQRQINLHTGNNQCQRTFRRFRQGMP